MILYAALFITLIVSLILLEYFYLDKRQVKDYALKAVLITGCDTGFGHDLTLKCLKEGMTVFAACLTQEGGSKLSFASRHLPGTLKLLIMDVRSDESVAQAKCFVEESLMKLDKELLAIVNNAGVVGSSMFDDFLDVADYKDVADVNTFGVIRVTQTFKDLVKKSKGRIITVASICARVPLPGIGPYTVSKYAVSGYCDTIRQELRPFGVDVCILEPGFFRTPLTDHSKISFTMDSIWEKSNSSIKNEYGKDFYQRYKKLTSVMLLKGASTHSEWVVDAYFHALTSKYPRRRYYIGYDAKFGFIPISCLPTRMLDLILAAAMKMAGLAKPAALS